MKPDAMELLGEDHYAEWDAFVQAAAGGTIFHTSWYLRGWGLDTKIFVLRDSKGVIEGGTAVTPSRFLGLGSAPPAMDGLQRSACACQQQEGAGGKTL